MRWAELKAAFLEIGSTRLTGEPADRYVSGSAAGPGAGGRGSVFFSEGTHRVRLSVADKSDVEIVHVGSGVALLKLGDLCVEGHLEPAALHCPRQAYITVSGTCIFNCRYCPVPVLKGSRKTPDEVIDMIEDVRDQIDAISVTSGVLCSIKEEVSCVGGLVGKLRAFGLPVGVSIYPEKSTPDLLRQLGVAEVKFNIEAATPELFRVMCPGLDYDLIWEVLARSVELFGRCHVFSNLIVGLGETDEELETCIRRLTSMGVIPVLRPLNPAASLKERNRPSKERLLKLLSIHEKALADACLDPCKALTMCVACTGCDLVPGRDI